MDDYEQIARLTGREWPGSADRVARTIHRTAEIIRDFPLIGRANGSLGTREMMLTRLPYAVVYRVEGDVDDLAAPITVVILRLRHTAMDLPGEVS